MRVLVVDDDGKISAFVAKGLKEAGFAVDVVANGADALAVARATPFDIAVVDVMLPGIDGLELIERMRTDPATVERGTRPILVAHWIERIGDRVTNVAEDVVFLEFSNREYADHALEDLTRRVYRDAGIARFHLNGHLLVAHHLVRRAPQ